MLACSHARSLARCCHDAHLCRSSQLSIVPPLLYAHVTPRCQQCRKKVGLTGFKCKCGMLFCGQHRYAEAHNCTFDYKSVERERLAANNPLVQASKVQRI